MPLSAEDRWEIHDLLVRYAYLIDHYGTPESEFLDLFTEDAVIESPIRGHYEGLEGVKAFTSQERQFRWAQPISFDRLKLKQLRHFVGNVLIEGDGNRGTLRAWLLTLITTVKSQEGVHHPDVGKGFAHTPTELGATGYYECEVRKVSGKWKLGSRILYLDGVSGGPYDRSKTPWQQNVPIG
jgi:hypothetical protein